MVEVRLKKLTTMKYLPILSYLLLSLGLGWGELVLPPTRQTDPVILKGIDLPEAIGFDPQSIVGFRFNEESVNWEQIPIQVDEVHQQDWDVLKQGDCRTMGRNYMATCYADTTTYSGPDEDPTFDDDDELVFMARHLGDEKPQGFINPPGVTTNLEIELDIQDPLLGFVTLGFVYLFQSDGSLEPGAGQKLVEYDFKLLKTDENGSNNYFDAYQFNCTDGTQEYECHDNFFMNPEDTWFRSNFYERHFSENWHTDALHIKAGDATGENILNTQDFQVHLDNCVRSTATFATGRTAFVNNKVGPVRVIRSWVGANSGTITQRELRMYEAREDQITYLRVHTIFGIMDYNVYNPEMYMTYYNCHNSHGIDINGVDDDEFNTPLCNWEMVTGEHGTLHRSIEIDFDDVDFVPEKHLVHWFYDNEIPDCVDCGHRGSTVHPNGWYMCSSIYNNKTAAWGSHGIKYNWPNYVMKNTDPLRHMHVDLPEGACRSQNQPKLHYFNVLMSMRYLEPNTDPVVGEQYYMNTMTKLIRNNI